MSGKNWSESYRTVFLSIDSYQQGVLQGRLYHPGLQQGKTFQSLSGFILEMEQLLETIEYPKSFTVTRTFAPPPPKDLIPPEEVYQEGKEATFALKILFRQNASWQGSVVWLEQKQEQSFRSVLELILLFDNALSQK